MSEPIIDFNSVIMTKISEVARDAGLAATRSAETSSDVKELLIKVSRIEAEYNLHRGACDMRFKGMQKAIQRLESRIDRHSQRLSELDGHEITQEHLLSELREDTMEIRRQAITEHREKRSSTRWLVGTLVALASAVAALLSVLWRR